MPRGTHINPIVATSAHPPILVQELVGGGLRKVPPQYLARICASNNTERDDVSPFEFLSCSEPLPRSLV